MNGTQKVTDTGNNRLPTPSVITDEYFKPEELIRELDASDRTLARWRALGIGPPRTVIGRTILYRREAVREWLRAREEHSRRRNGR